MKTELLLKLDLDKLYYVGVECLHNIDNYEQLTADNNRLDYQVLFSALYNHLENILDELTEQTRMELINAINASELLINNFDKR
jgi:hypothetical protein